MAIIYPCFGARETKSFREVRMKPEFSGIEKRLEKLNNCLNKLEPLKDRTLEEIQDDPYLQDVIERNFEVAAQSCIDIANRIIAGKTWKSRPIITRRSRGSERTRLFPEISPET